MVKTLLQAKANPNKADMNGTTPLVMATTEGWLGVIKELIDFGADPFVKVEGETLLDLSPNPIIRSFIQKAQEVQKLKKKSFELLDEIEKDPQRVHDFILLMDKELMKKGIMRMVDEQKNTLLHKAAEIGNVALAQSILKRAPSLIAEKNNAGFTPIELAIAKGRFNVVKMFTEEAIRVSKAASEVIQLKQIGKKKRKIG